MRDLFLGLDADQPAEHGIAAQLGQARLVGGMPEQRSEDSDAPEGGAGVRVAMDTVGEFVRAIGETGVPSPRAPCWPNSG